MIRTLILAAAVSLAFAAAAKSDGFEPGPEPRYERTRSHRVVHHRPAHHVRRHVQRHAYGRPYREIAPGGLTQPPMPVYNTPPHRFP